MIECALILLAITVALAIAAWRSLRDLWTVLPEGEDEHAEPYTKAPGLPHNRKGR